MAQYSFDPSNNRERADAIKVLKALEPQAFDSSSNSRFGAQSPMTSYDQPLQQISNLQHEVDKLQHEKKNLTSDLDRSRSEIAKRDQQIEHLEDKITKINNDLDTKIKQVKENAEVEAQVKIDEINKNFTESIRKKDEEYRRLERESRNKALELEKEIESLKKRLEAYEPVGAEVGEEKLFNIDTLTHSLEETNDTAAPYKVRIVSSEKVIFQFNTDSGPMISACANRSEMLEPFCEIIDAAEGATAIRRGAWGEAKLSPSGNIRIEDITKKAQISLIRN